MGVAAHIHDQIGRPEKVDYRSVDRLQRFAYLHVHFPRDVIAGLLVAGLGS